MRPLVRSLALLAAALGLLAEEPRGTFHIKYVAEGAVYIDAGRAAGIAEGMKLTVRRGDQGVAELQVVNAAQASAVCEIRSSTAELQAGDAAVLSSEDAQRSQLLRAAGSGAHYSQTITFTEGYPLEEEIRD